MTDNNERSIYQTAIEAILDKHCQPPSAAEAIKGLFALWAADVAQLRATRGATGTTQNEPKAGPAKPQDRLAPKRRRVVEVTPATPNQGRVWSAEDVATLKRMTAEGKSVSEVAKVLGRNTRAVISFEYTLRERESATNA